MSSQVEIFPQAREKKSCDSVLRGNFEFGFLRTLILQGPVALTGRSCSDMNLGSVKPLLEKN